MTEFSLFTVSLLIVTGLIAGVINTLAGGGSNLTIPALMVMGLPADIANATNRVGVLLQSVAGVRGFHRHGKLDSGDTLPVLVPNLLGGLVGALCAAALPVPWLKPLLLGTMVGMSLLILLRPGVVAPPKAPSHAGFAKHPRPGLRCSSRASTAALCRRASALY